MALLSRETFSRRSFRPGGRVARWIAPGLALALLASGPVAAAPAPSREFQVKAVFLFNFTQFVLWPQTAFAHERGPLCIGVLGEDPFGAALEEAVAGETVRNRPVVVARFARVADVRDCHVLYIAASEAANADHILAQLHGKPILTVSDLPRFAQRGGIVRFYLEGAKVRLEINASAAQRHGLKLNSQLLNLARIVPETTGSTR